MLDMMKRHEIQVLRRAGHSQPDVAKLTGVSELRPRAGINGFAGMGFVGRRSGV
jgi:hypothetical protein